MLKPIDRMWRGWCSRSFDLQLRKDFLAKAILHNAYNRAVPLVGFISRVIGYRPRMATTAPITNAANAKPLKTITKPNVIVKAAVISLILIQ